MAVTAQLRNTPSLAHQGKVDVRDDEEQYVKLQQCLDLLLAAGYYRARIQGLPPFDKVVGGMAWCIETCCIDLDVDLLYHDSLTIGQKISLTERLVCVLPVLRCPHALQPHQVQGLDACHLLPVIQWLVREALTRRALYGSVSRAVAAQHHAIRHTAATPPSPQQLQHTLTTIQCGYWCVRRWTSQGSSSNQPPQQRVHSTLLEYSQEKPEHPKPQQQGTAQQTAVVLAPRAGQQALLRAAAASTRPSPQHQPASLTVQLRALQVQVSALQQQEQEQQQVLQQEQQQVQRWSQQMQELRTHLQQLQPGDTAGADMGSLKRLLEQAEDLKRAEQRYKDECRLHVAALHSDIRSAEERLSSSPPCPPALLSLAEEERVRLQKVQVVAAAAARQVAVLRRAWDDVPATAELAQYRHRLTELNDLVMSSERETHQFYTMLSTLRDSKAAMDQHLTLLNDILDSIPSSVRGQEGSEQLLRHVATLLDGVLQHRATVCSERSEQQQQQAAVVTRLTALQDTARLYTRTALALTVQLARNQQLVAPTP